MNSPEFPHSQRNMDVRQDWPERGRTVTFSQWDFDGGRARFIGIGVVAGPAQQHPYLDLYRFPIMPRPGDERAVPEWINESDIIDVVPR